MNQEPRDPIWWRTALAVIRWGLLAGTVAKERVVTSLAAIALATLAVGLFARMPAAQMNTGVYEACRPDNAEIRAANLPRLVDQRRCPVSGRAIVDGGGLGIVLPEPGVGVSAEALTLDGALDFTVINSPGAIFVLEDVGNEVSAPVVAPEPGTFTALGSDPRGCDDPAHNPDPANRGARLYRNLRWNFNSGSTPPGMSVSLVEQQIVLAGANIAHVDNPCGVADGVGVGMTYEGRTDRSVDMSASGDCLRRDDYSVVGFGHLRAGWLAYHCATFVVREGQDEVVVSDIRMNKGDGVHWTTKITDSCQNKVDVQGVMTHERGHTFGMKHVQEEEHPYLTMSELINGYCSAAERSLGRGDALGLNEKY